MTLPIQNSVYYFVSSTHQAHLNLLEKTIIPCFSSKIRLRISIQFGIGSYTKTCRTNFILIRTGPTLRVHKIGQDKSIPTKTWTTLNRTIYAPLLPSDNAIKQRH